MVVAIHGFSGSSITNNDDYCSCKSKRNEDEKKKRAMALVAALKACSLSRNSHRGRMVHWDAALRGDESELSVGNALVNMYAKCGSLDDARRIFDAMPRHNTVSWNVLMLAYAQLGQPEMAVELFRIMPSGPNRISFVTALKACANFTIQERKTHRQKMLVLGIHSRARELGLESDIRVASALVTAYAKCGMVAEARQVFDKVKHPDVVLWTSVMLCYVENDQEDTALELLKRMTSRSPVDSSALVVALKACSSLAVKQHDTEIGEDAKWNKLRCLETVMGIHAKASTTVGVMNSLLASSLVDSYAKCGSIADAQCVFASVPVNSHTVFTWTSLMSAYTHIGDEDSALEVLAAMISSNHPACRPNAHTLAAALKAVTGLAAREEGQLLPGLANPVKLVSLERGMWIHQRLRDDIPSSDLNSQLFVANSLVAMYAKCGSLEDATRVFEGMQTRNVVSWTCLMSGLVDAADEESALDLLERMACSGAEPNAHTLVAALKAIAGLAAKKAATSNTWLEKGMALHSYARRGSGIHNPRVVNSLVVMYAKCEALEDAARLLNASAIPHHQMLPAWTSLMSAYTDAGCPQAAVDLVLRLPSPTPCCHLDAGALTVALDAAGSTAALDDGRRIHALVCRLGFLDAEHKPALQHSTSSCSSSSRLETSVVDMYAKCGCMLRCELVLQSLPSPAAATLNALLSGLSRQGDTESLVLWLRRMAEEGVAADASSLTCLLAACSRAGMVDAGKRYFDSAMASSLSRPRMEHYHCMVDMLGRANRVVEALEVVEAMAARGVAPNAVTWTTLLAACAKSSPSCAARVQVAQRAFDALVRLEDDEKNAASYVMMAGIYGTV